MGQVSPTGAVAISPMAARGKQCLLALERLETKKTVIGQLIDGRLHLLDAAARFRELAPPSNAILGISETQDGDEHWCRSVIGWVCLALSEQPERADVLAGRLEAELAAHVAKQAAMN
jgi:hypothetical protein